MSDFSYCWIGGAKICNEPCFCVDMQCCPPGYGCEDDCGYLYDVVQSMCRMRHITSTEMLEQRKYTYHDCAYSPIVWKEYKKLMLKYKSFMVDICSWPQCEKCGDFEYIQLSNDEKMYMCHKHNDKVKKRLWRHQFMIWRVLRDFLPELRMLIINIYLRN